MTRHFDSTPAEFADLRRRMRKGARTGMRNRRVDNESFRNDSHRRVGDGLAVGMQSLVERLGPAVQQPPPLGGAASGSANAVQRKESKDDGAILANQAHLQNTDVEIPALEGALLATRKEAVKRGLLSQASFDAGLALSQAMTQLQPAVAAKRAVDKDLQQRAAVAAQQLFAS